MWYPDLLHTKAVAFRRQEAQRTGGDPYAQPATLPVYQHHTRTGQVRRLQCHLGDRLVTWGQRLQQLGELQTLLR